MTRKKNNKKNTGKKSDEDSHDASQTTAETSSLSAEVSLKDEVNVVLDAENIPSGRGKCRGICRKK